MAIEDGMQFYRKTFAINCALPDRFAGLPAGNAYVRRAVGFEVNGDAIAACLDFHIKALGAKHYRTLRRNHDRTRGFRPA